MQKAATRVLVAMADPYTRMCYAREFTESGWDVHTSGDGREALAMLRELPSDALVLQLPLKVYDGLEVLRRIPEAGLYTCPGIVMSIHPGMERYGEEALRFGAAVCLGAHTDAREVIAACANIRPQDRLYASAGRKDDIRDLLDSLAFPREHPGTGVLEAALSWTLSDGRLLNDLAHRLYPLVAATQDMSAAQVERSIRHAIEAAWSRGYIEEQYALFENTIDEKRGKPTNGGMLARATEFLRAKEGAV